jgi:hypothetical protein
MWCTPVEHILVQFGVALVEEIHLRERWHVHPKRQLPKKMGVCSPERGCFVITTLAEGPALTTAVVALGAADGAFAEIIIGFVVNLRQGKEAACNSA